MTVPNLSELFAAEVERIARQRGIEGALKRKSGLLIQRVWTNVSQRQMDNEGKLCNDTLPQGDLVHPDRVAAHVRKCAEAAYIGKWWAISYPRERPEEVGPHDVYLSADEVRALVPDS